MARSRHMLELDSHNARYGTSSDPCTVYLELAAWALEPNFPNSNLSVQDARPWRAGIEVYSLGLSAVIVEEFKKLNLFQMRA
jgi:hypothetical protein